MNVKTLSKKRGRRKRGREEELKFKELKQLNKIILILMATA